jgi:hypothetical protein
MRSRSRRSRLLLLARRFSVPSVLRRGLAPGSRERRACGPAAGVAVGATVQVLGVVAEVAEAAEAGGACGRGRRRCGGGCGRGQRGDGRRCEHALRVGAKGVGRRYTSGVCVGRVASSVLADRLLGRVFCWTRGWDRRVS